MKEKFKDHKVSHRIVVVLLSFLKGILGVTFGIFLIYLSLMVFFTLKEPTNYIASIPIFSFGITIFTFSVYFFKEGTFDVLYSRIHCPFCKNPVRIKNHDLLLECKNCGHNITIQKIYKETL